MDLSVHESVIIRFITEMKSFPNYSDEHKKRYLGIGRVYGTLGKEDAIKLALRMEKKLNGKGLILPGWLLNSLISKGSKVISVHSGLAPVVGTVSSLVSSQPE
jgi:hypothetical protein